jgi:hypothetical protein
MMILDLNQVMIANLMMQLGGRTTASLDENLVRHMILNTIRSLNSKYRATHGELVIAADGANSWRRDVFPYYKANRRKNNDESIINWADLFKMMNLIRDEIKDNFPYAVVHIDRVEADDVIATLVHNKNTFDKVLILSGDKDFNQLQTYPNVQQYDPTRKKFIECKSPDTFLKEHVIKGDVSDGIPNILSSDNCFVLGERQTPMTKKRMEEFMAMEPSKMPRNYFRNDDLINLGKIPEEYVTKILEEHEKQLNKPKKDLLSFFISKRLKHLTESLGDFL